MKRFLMLALGCVVALHAQDITGDWQGTLNVAGGWKAAIYSIDRMPDPLPVSSITLHGADLAFSVGGL